MNPLSSYHRLTPEQKKAKRDLYKDTKRYRDMRRIRNKRKRDRLSEVIRRLKNKPCMDCQGWYEPCQMQFDHRDRITKLGLVAKFKSTRKIYTEAEKCDVVCANCHALRTQTRQDWIPVKRVIDALPTQKAA